MSNVDAGVRRRRLKRRIKRIRPFVILFLIALVVGIILFARSSYFTVYNVKVEGNHRYTDSEVMALTDEPIIGENLYSVNKRNIKKALKQNLYFDDVDVERKAPDTIIINVVENESMAAVPCENGTYAVTDKDGVVLEITDSPQRCTIISGINAADPRVGKTLKTSDDVLFSSALKELTTLDESDLFFVKMDTSAVKDRLYISDNLYFESDRGELTDKADAIKSMLYKLNEQGITRGVVTIGDGGYVSFNPVTE